MHVGKPHTNMCLPNETCLEVKWTGSETTKVTMGDGRSTCYLFHNFDHDFHNFDHDFHNFDHDFHHDFVTMTYFHHDRLYWRMRVCAMKFKPGLSTKVA